MNKTKEHKSCICGIHCDVTNCVHNNNKCGCTASNITVGPHHANSCKDTVCQSFKEEYK